MNAKTASQYRSALRSYVRGLWNGSFGLFQFVDGFTGSILRHYPIGWLEGSSEFGVISQRELTGEELAALYQEMNVDIGYINGFADDILQNSKANKGALQPLMDRVELWVNRYVYIVNQGRLHAQENPKLKWELGATGEHCIDCSRLAGKVYRASIWRKYGIAPRSKLLNCGGHKCACDLKPTNDPVTPGRPPNLVGPGKRVRKRKGYPTLPAGQPMQVRLS